MMTVLSVCLMMTMAMPQGIAFAETQLADDIVILYSGDLHGSVDNNTGLDGLVAYANEKRSSNRYVELVDTGDALSGTTLASVSKGEFVVDAMNASGYSLAVPGVRDFDYGVSRLTETLADVAKYEYLSCNFIKADSTAVFKPYKVVAYGDVKVGYIGISDPLTISKAGAPFANGIEEQAYSFEEGEKGQKLYNRVQTAIDGAKTEGADYIVVIGHLTSNYDEFYSPTAIIENTAGINAFIAGGSHKALDGQQVKTKDDKYALLTCPAAGLMQIGVLNISPNKSLSSQLIGGYQLRDIKTRNTLEELKIKYQDQLGEIFATTASKLEAANSSGVRIVESSETNLGDLCADAYRNATGADVAFVEASEIKSDISSGDISYKDVVTALPSNENLSVIQATGYEIMDALEMSARFYPRRNSGFLQVSGITYDILETVMPSVTTDVYGNFTGVSDDYRVTNIKINGKELDLMADYTVAGTTRFLDGNSGYSMFSKCPLKSANVTTDNQALITYISKELEGEVGEAYSKSQNRIDSIKLARQSEIDKLVSETVEEQMRETKEQLAELREQIERQQAILDIKELELTASSKFAKVSGKRSITVSWKASEKISGIKYQVYKSTKKSSGFKKIATTSKSTYKNASGLSKGKTYYYRVRAYRYIGNKYYYSNWSNVTYKKVSK